MPHTAMSRTSRSLFVKTPWLALSVILLLSWFLLNLDLEGKNLWTDELFTARWARLSLEETIQRTVADYHPPLYFLLSNLWTRCAGRSDFALRWLSIASACLNVALLYRLGRVLAGYDVGWLSAAMWAFSPLVMLYGRMARYYSLAAFFGLCSGCALLHAVARRRWRYWIVYVMFASAALYTFYLTGLLLVAQGLLPLKLKGRRAFLRWLAAVLLAVLSLSPWSSVVASQAARTGGGAADLAFGITGMAVKVAYPVYALALGESLFPWHPLAVIGGTAGALLLAIGLARWREQGFLLPLLCLLLIPLLGMILVTTLVSPRTPFVSLPARGFFAAPYFSLMLGGSLRRYRLRLIGPTVLALGAAWFLSLANYYLGQQYLNPIYLTPSKDIVELVLSQLRPGDIIVSPDDSGVDYYYGRSGAQQPHYYSADQALDYHERNDVERVWLVALGRDQTRRSASVTSQAWLHTHFRLAKSWGYVPQDPTYRAIKSYLLGRQAYEYRATLTLYVVKDR